MVEKDPAQDKPNKKKKPKKRKGLFRKSWLPLIILIGGGAAYGILLFDAHMKMALEKVGAIVNGAEVNVGRFETSFRGGWLEIEGVQVTDAALPTHNKLALDLLRFRFSWDALLRAKVLVEESSLEGISMGSLRDEPGFVVPPEDGEAATAEPETEARDDGPGFVEKLRKLAEFDRIIADAKNIDYKELPSIKEAMALKEELSGKQTEWQGLLEGLPGKADLDRDKKTIAGLSKGIKNPKQVKERVAAAKKIISANQDAIKKVGDNTKQFKNELKAYQDRVAGLGGNTDRDQEYVLGKLNLPELEFDQVGEELLGPELFAKVKEVQKYIDMARKHMGTGSGDATAPAEAGPKRALRLAGQTYDFGQNNGYPLFWLKTMSISSKETASGFSGNLQGSLINATTSPRAVGSPTILDVAGSFAKKQLHDVAFRVVIDHLEVPTEEVTLGVGRMVLEPKTFADSKQLRLAVREGSGAIHLQGKMLQDSAKIVADAKFSQLDYDIGSSSARVSKVLTSVLQSIPVVTFEAVGEGPLSALQWTIKSNLSKALKDGINQELKAELDRLKAEIRAKIDAKIAEARAQVDQKIAEVRSKVQGQLDAKKQQLEAVKGQAEGKVSEIKGGLDAQRKALQAKLKAEADAKKAEAMAKAKAAQEKAAAAKRKAEEEAKRKAKQKAKEKLKGKLPF